MTLLEKVLLHIEQDIWQDLHEKTHIPDTESTVYSFNDVHNMLNEYPFFSHWSPEEKALAAHTVWSTLNWEAPHDVIESHIYKQGATWLEYERTILDLIKYN